MSKIIVDVSNYAYATATGILIVMAESFLLHDGSDKEISARAFINVVEDTNGLPPSIIKLKDEVKQKYNF
jgi:hypothetical protein